MENENKHFVRDFLQFGHSDTLKQDTSCSFPHSYCDGRGIEDETCGRVKTSISYKTSFRFDTVAASKSTRFGASPIVTAMAEGQKMKRVGESKRAFRTRLPSDLTLWQLQIDAFWSFPHSYCDGRGQGRTRQEDTRCNCSHRHRIHATISTTISATISTKF